MQESQAKPRATLTMRIWRAATQEWEDVPAEADQEEPNGERAD